MKDVIDFFEGDEYKKRYHDNIVYMNAIYKAMTGSAKEAEDYFTFQIRNYTVEAQERVILKIKKIGADVAARS